MYLFTGTLRNSAELSGTLRNSAELCGTLRNSAELGFQNIHITFQINLEGNYKTPDADDDDDETPPTYPAVHPAPHIHVATARIQKLASKVFLIENHIETRKLLGQ